MKKTVLMLALLTLVSAAAIAAAPVADDKTPDFSGSWSMDKTKSDYGQMPPPDSVTLTIDHKDPKLKVKTASKGGMRGDTDTEANYTTDGKETSNTMGPTEAKTTAKWDGKKLAMVTKASFQGNDFVISETWELSEDGKVLTQNRSFKADMGEFAMKVVYNKQ